MLARIRGFLEPPELGDAEQNRQGSLLHHSLLVLILSTIAFQLALSLLAQENRPARAMLLAAFLAEVLAYWQVRHGRLRIASIVLLSWLWALLSGTILLASGINGVATLGQLLIIFLSGLLVGEGFAAFIALATILVNYLAMLAQQAGPLPLGGLPFGLPTIWVFQSIFFLITLGLMQIYVRNLRAIFTEVEQNAETLRNRISELRQAQAQLELSDQNLRRREAILESVSIASEKLFRGKYFGESVQQMMKDLGQATGVDRVHIFENHRDPLTGDLLSSERYEWAAEKVPPQIREPRYQSMSYKGAGLQRWAEKLARNEVIKAHVNDLPEIERERLEPQALRSLLIVPIFVGQDWWGFIGFDETKREREWTPAEEDALRGAAGILGGAIERRQAEQALNQSEARYLAILQDQFDLICRYTPEGRMTFANDAYCRYFGVDQKHLTKSTIWANVLQPEAEVLRAKIESLTPKKPAVKSLAQNRRADGELRWLEWTDRGIFDEMGRLVEVQAVGRDIEEEVKLRAQLQENLRLMETQAMTDPLTGLLNRRAILEHLQAEWERAQREEKPLSLMIMDLDQLKEINDSQGHAAGDEALKKVAETMHSNMRRYDWAGRWGGDEFMLLLPNADMEEARNVAERLRVRLKKNKLVVGPNKEIELRLSLGVASQERIEEGKGSSDDLIVRADRALLAAKRAGRDRVAVAD